MKQTELKRKTPLSKGTKRLQPIGRRGKRLTEGDKSVTSMARLSTVCELKHLVPKVICVGHLTPHHKSKRNDIENRHNPENIAVLCISHHTWVEHHPSEARKLGLRIDSKSKLIEG